METIRIDDGTRVLVLTGAGVSAESGIPTFRGTSGLWEDHAVEKVASPQGFVDDPALVWRFYSERRAGAKGVAPNPGHEALARLEERLGDRLLLATQNVDGLHSRAGSRRVVEMHGNLFRSRCSRCARPAFDDTATYDASLPACGRCHEKGEFSLLRPDIVWFGESLDAENLLRIESFLSGAREHRLVFLAVGTSGRVSPASDLVRHARSRDAETWLVNLETPDNASGFEHVVTGESGRVLPSLFA